MHDAETTTPTPDELLTIGDAALRVGVHPSTIRRWANRGILPAARVSPGGHRRFTVEDVDRITSAREVIKHPAEAS